MYAKHTLAAAVAGAALALALLSCAPSGGGGGSAAGGPAPRIDLLDPLHGQVGQAVTIEGANFASSASGDAVFFGATQASILSASSGRIVTQVPAGTPMGATQVTVSTAAGTSAGVGFTVDPSGGSSATPAITGLAPDTGPPGTAVAISGSAFDPAAGGNTVTFNGAAAQVSQASATRLDVVVPGAATSGQVVVRTSAGTSNGVPFTVTSPTPVDQGASGSKAHDYLAAVPFSALLVEVDYIQGQAPDSAALAFLEQRLGERCNKPAGLTIRLGDEIPPQGIATWRLDQDIRPLEATWRGSYATGNTAVLYVVYVNGGSEFDTQSSRVLGISYSGSSIVIFKDGVRGSATALLTGPAIERAVLVHEAGHAMGLVDNGAPMKVDHLDRAHGKHDTNQNCVMFWQIETSLINQILGTVPNDFDANCIDDLRLLGGR